MATELWWNDVGELCADGDGSGPYYSGPVDELVAATLADIGKPERWPTKEQFAAFDALKKGQRKRKDFS